MKLILGVIDQPYDNNDGEKSTTTGKVAQLLEDKYHVMETFYEANRQEVADMAAESLLGALENLELGGPVDADPFLDLTQDVTASFKKFLSTGQIEQLGIPGVPTQASLLRKSSRFKSGKAGKGRPSFIDTGLYQASFVSWVE